MYRAWEIIRGLAAAAGFGLMLLSVGTSDYYVMELGRHEPVNVWALAFIGLAMMLPAALHAIREEYKELMKQENEKW